MNAPAITPLDQVALNDLIAQAGTAANTGHKAPMPELLDESEIEHVYEHARDDDLALLAGEGWGAFDDWSAALQGLAVRLARASGCTGPELLTVLASNPGPMAVALAHRRDNETKATRYLHEHHVLPALAKAGAPIEFDVLPDLPENDPAMSSPAALMKRGRLVLPALADAVAAQHIATEPPAPRELVKGLIAAGTVGGLTGAGGHGKSSAAVQIAMGVSAGGCLLGNAAWPVAAPGAVAILNSEDAPDEFARRLHRAARAEWETEHDLEGDAITPWAEFIQRYSRIYYVHVGGQDVRLTDMHGRQSPQLAQIIDYLRQIPDLALVILDPLASFNGGQENANEAMQAVVNACRRIAQETGAATLVVHHVPKAASMNGDRGAEAARGGFAFSNGLRWQLGLATMTEDEAKRYGIDSERRREFVGIEVAKSNYGPAGALYWFKRTRGTVLHHVTLHERGDRKREDAFALFVAFCKEVLPEQAAAGTEYSPRAFAERYAGEGGPLGVGEKTLRQLIARAVDAEILVLRAPAPGVNHQVKQVLALGPTT